MKKVIRAAGLGLLGLALVACSQQSIPQANATPQETAQNLGTLSEEVQQVIQELANAFQGLGLPSWQPSIQGLDPGALQALLNLRLDAFFSVRPPDLVPLATNPLPRGQAECIGGNCYWVGPSDDLEISKLAPPEYPA
ncbi:hypothetical protein [Thermus tenuipuniceus]|uniref:hypothetical protein n=1 Tax=Thermus tenuipuniceus TaxID=2078690 RepID=UPI000CF943D7|nr:hypothetical protein [Thermus tenuipuniceus]